MPKKCKISNIELPESAAKELETYLKKNFAVSVRGDNNERVTHLLVCKAGQEAVGKSLPAWSYEKLVDMKSIILKALNIDLT